MQRHTITLTLTLLAGLPAGFAQRGTDSTLLDQVSISTNRMERKVQDAPRMVTVLQAKDLAASQCNSLGELLSMQAGANVIGATQMPGANQSLFLRGTGSHQTAVLIDGVRISDPSTPNGAMDLSEFSLADIERIEIVQGGHSTMYGNGALGGVVNIITKKAAAGGNVNRVFLHGGLIGPGHSSGISASTQQSKGGAFIAAQARHYRFDGISAAADPKNGSTFLNEADGFTKSDFALRGGWGGKKLQAWAGWRYNTQETDIDAGAFSDDENYTLRMERHTFHSGVDYKINDRYGLHFTGGISNLVRRSVNDSSLVSPGVFDGTFYRDRFSGSNRNADLFLQRSGARFSWTAGLSYLQEVATVNSFYYSRIFSYESTTSYDSLDLQNQVLAAYWQGNLNLGKRTGVSGGARMSHHNRYGWIPSFEINPWYRLGQHSILFTNLSSGFAVPSLYQLLAPERSFSGMQRGNPNLSPENGFTSELGYKRRGEKASFQVSVFHNRTRKAIQYVYAWRSRPIDSLTFMDNIGDTYINNGRTVQTGLQLEGSVQFSRRLSLQGNITVLQGRQEFEAVNGNYLYQTFESGAFLNRNSQTDTLSRRFSTLNLRMNYAAGKYGIVSLRTRACGPRADVAYDGTRGPYGALGYKVIEPWVLFDLLYSVPLSKNRIQAGLSVQNLANTVYQDILGFNTRLRSLMCNLAFRF
jgi:vitamin B12 transporter